MTDRIISAPLFVVAAGCLLAGCSPRTDRPATYSVRGKVTYEGQPVAGATVAFLAEGAPRPAVGTTDAAGNYHLTTFEPDDGAILGTHIVTVKQYESEPVRATPVEEGLSTARVDSAAVERAMQETALQMAKAEEAGSGLPEKYGHRTTSDLREEVVDGENVIDIELTD